MGASIWLLAVLTIMFIFWIPYMFRRDVMMEHEPKKATRATIALVLAAIVIAIPCCALDLAS